MVTGSSMVSLGNALSYSSLGSGRISMPVLKSQVIYANFEHVSGVASSTGGGATIDKLKILNTLIDRLTTIKSQPSPGDVEMKGLTSDRLDAMISTYQGELQAAAAAAPRPYVAKPFLEPGLLVDLSA